MYSGIIVLCIHSKHRLLFCRLLVPVPPVDSDAVVEVGVETRDIPKQDIKEEVKYTAINDRLSCSSAQSSSSSAGSWRGRAEHQYQRPLGDIFIRYVYDQDGVRQTLAGKDADASLYEATMRLDHYYSDSEEDVVGISEDAQRRRKYSTMSCGFADDGTLRRLPKKELRYSRQNLKAMLEIMYKPRTSIILLFKQRNRSARLIHYF